MVYKFFDKAVNTRTGISDNQKLVYEVYKPTTKKVPRLKVYSSCQENTWIADLADMLSLNKYNKGIRFLPCIIDVCSNYVCVIPLKDKKGIINTSAFQKTLYEWVDQCSEFYYRSTKSRLHDNSIKIGIEGKYTVAERFIRTLKRKIYKHMNLLTKCAY